MNEKLKVSAVMTVAMLFWGISFIWSEQALKIYHPFTLVLFRLIISVILMILINLWYRKIQIIDKKDILIFVCRHFCNLLPILQEKTTALFKQIR